MPGPATNGKPDSLGQWRHPAALRTFIFPTGRFRGRQTDADSRDSDEDRMRKERTMGRRRGLKERERKGRRDMEKGRLKGVSKKKKREEKVSEVERET